MPTVLTRIVNHPELDRFDLTSLRMIGYGAEPIPRNTLEKALAKFGPILVQNYGQTEAMMTVHDAAGGRAFRARQRTSRASAASGGPTPSSRSCCASHPGSRSRPGEIGEITMRSDHVMLGYWRMPEETAKALRDGWLWTGDLARMDETGLITLTGRSKEMLISGGHNIYPQEVEAVLTSCPGVLEAAVVGAARSELGRDRGRLRLARRRRRLAPKRSPPRSSRGSASRRRSASKSSTLPKTGNGKVDKKLLRERLAMGSAPERAARRSGGAHAASPSRCASARAGAELRRIARSISAVENQSDGYEALLADAYRMPRWPTVIGITGPPGVGKSTLVDALTAHWAAGGERVAILAIDPSSPYSGGAVLGDRIRRVRSAGLTNTYFRSLSARGHVGGVNETATDIVAVLSLFDFKRVIIETVGAGQSDIEIHAIADCTVVMTVPGLGDGIQASKAGLMEIGDVFVVNKADMPGADNAARTIENALAVAYTGEPGVNEFGAARPPRPPSTVVTPGLAALRRRHGDPAVDASTWVPPVLAIVAADNRRVDDLAARIDAFVAWSECTGRLVQRAASAPTPRWCGRCRRCCSPPICASRIGRHAGCDRGVDRPHRRRHRARSKPRAP